MKKSTPAFVEIAVNIFVSFILYFVFNYFILDGNNEFFRSFRGFLFFYIIITVMDLLWKLVKRFLDKRKK